MPFTDEQNKLLDVEIDRDRIKGRQGPSGRTLSYLSQEDVKATANRIFGFGKWSYKPVELVHIGTEPITREVKRGDQTIKEDGFRVVYRATVELSFTDSDAVYVDVGYGEDVSYSNTTLQQHELATKEAVSDALKRAFVPLGNQFGLSLYAEATAMRSGGGGGRGRRRENETRTPPLVTQNDLAALHAERNKFGISEEDMRRLARFVSGMQGLESMKELPRSCKKGLIEALGYFASNPDDAEHQMQEVEQAAAEAAGMPGGYG